MKILTKYRFVEDLDEMDFEFVHRAISESYWAKGIPESVMRRAMENSMCFGILDPEGKQVAFARMVTDYATYAYLADVFVNPDHRGRGLSKKLVKEIMDHPELQGLRRITLATKDAHGLYEQFGFTPLNKPDYFMERWDPEIYQRTSND